MSQKLLDTDTISYILRCREPVVSRVRQHIATLGPIAISTITCYEIWRGLLFAGASRQLLAFELFITENEIFSLDSDSARVAASIHAGLRRAGIPLPDADILIAAIALTHDCVLVTNNVRHYRRIPDLRLENWAS